MIDVSHLVTMQIQVRGMIQRVEPHAEEDKLMKGLLSQLKATKTTLENTQKEMMGMRSAPRVMTSQSLSAVVKPSSSRKTSKEILSR